MVSAALSAFGGLRRGLTIARQAAANLTQLEAGGWLRVEENFQELLSRRSRLPDPGDFALEREAAVFVQGNSPVPEGSRPRRRKRPATWDGLGGFGPKQSRNLWQWLGLSRFEIPLDSRTTTWLNSNRIFPFVLSAQALADENYYAFIMDGVRNLCAAAGILPCVFDAVVFSLGENWHADSLDY
jgi:hypothetical protein